jgi:hypothetical protein
MQTIHMYMIGPGHAGYAAGTGGQILIELRTDDGTSAHNPTSTVLTSYLLTSYLNATPSIDFPIFTFPTPANLVAGNLYHIVFTNVDPNPSVNYLSVDATYLQNPPDPWQPTVSNTDSAELLSNNGQSWQPRAGYLPILQLDYTDGWQEGMGYMEVWIGVPQNISGTANGVREQFTVSGAQRNVGSVAMRVARVSGSDPLTVLLKDANGNVIEQGNIPASSFPSASSYTWVSYPFVSAHTLVPGNSYSLELATASSSTYQAFPIRKGVDYNFAGTTYYTDGYAQFKQSGGWVGWTQWGVTNRTDGDLQFYFEVIGSGTGTGTGTTSTPPVISNLSAGSVTSSGAIVSWNTDQPATGQVQYGTTTAYAGSTAQNATLATGHAQQISGLAANTLYHYRVLSANSSGNQAVSGDATFTTATASSSIPVTPPSGPITLVQQKTTTYASASSVVVNLSAAPHVGNALVLFSANNSVGISGVSGGGVTWARAGAGASHSALDVWYGLNSSGSGAAVTVSYADATGSGGINISEFAGVAASNGLDVAPATTAGVSTSPTTPTAATTNANDLIIAATADLSVGATTAGPTNGFTALSEAVNANKIVPAYRVVTATGSYSAGWTEPNEGWDAAIVALKAAVGTSAVSTPTASLSSVAVSPTSVTGGSSSTGTITLSGAAPTGGATVSLTSSNTAAAQVPASVAISAGATSATFTVSTTAVSSVTAVTITGSYNSGTQKATLTVNPLPSVSLSSVALNPTSVTGGSSSTGTVTLSGAAPTGGASVSLSSNTAAAQVPATVAVSAGATSATFTVTTTAVTSLTSVTVTGNYNGAKTATMSVNPATVSGSITFVQQKTATYTSAASVVVNLAAAPHAGSALVLFSANNNVVVTGVSGGGVSWVQGRSGAAHDALDIWYGLNSSGSGTAITVSYTNATGSGGVNISEFSGVATTNAIDVVPSSTAGVSTNPTTPKATTTNANDLIVAAAADLSVAATTGGPTNGFTALSEAANANKIIPAYRIVTGTGSYSTGWNESNEGWDTAIIALKSR